MSYLKAAGHKGLTFVGYAASLGESSTSGSWTEKLSLDLSDIPAGDYEIIACGYLVGSSSATDPMGRVQIDDTTTIVAEIFYDDDTYASNGWMPMFVRTKATLTEGDHNIDIDFQRDGSLGSAYIKQAVIVVYSTDEKITERTQYCDYKEQESQQSTTSTSYTEKFTFALNDFPAGKYLIICTAKFSVTNDRYYMGIQCQLDDTTDLLTSLFERKGEYGSSIWSDWFVIRQVSLDGDHDIDIDILTESASYTAYLKQVRCFVMGAQ